MKVQTLVKKGYKQAAFANRDNAQKFASAWRAKGYKVESIRSSGPVSEGGFKRNAYYMIATKRKVQRRTARRQSNPFNFRLF